MSYTIEPFYSVSGQIEPDYISGANDNYNLYYETVDPDGTVDNIIGYEDTRINNREAIINPEYDTKLRKDHFMKSNTLKKNLNITI